MAIIYGCSQSEKEIIERCPIPVKDYDDIEITHHELIQDLGKKSRKFHDELPNKIVEEERYLETIQNHKSSTIEKFDNKIGDIANDIEEHKKNRRWFAVSITYPKKWIIEYFTKPGEIKRIEVSEKNQKEILLEWKQNPEKIFHKNNKELLYSIDKFNEVKANPYYSGAYGEVEVLKELSKLNSSCYILCGLNIELKDWHTYNRAYLRSAQIDYVVVSSKGIFLIEVKNWSNNYMNKNNGLNPYEQVDRAGRVLYLFLNWKLSGSVPRITKVLLPLHNSIPYNPRYRSVLISNLNRINDFIEKRSDELSDSEVNTVASILRKYVS